jgi:hypothetical protein
MSSCRSLTFPVRQVGYDDGPLQYVPLRQYEVECSEITHPDRLDESLFLRVDTRPPDFFTDLRPANSRVHKVEIEILHSGPFQRFLQVREGSIVGGVGSQFGGQVDLRSSSVGLF